MKQIGIYGGLAALVLALGACNRNTPTSEATDSATDYPAATASDMSGMSSDTMAPDVGASGMATGGAMTGSDGAMSGSEGAMSGTGSATGTATGAARTPRGSATSGATGSTTGQ